MIVIWINTNRFKRWELLDHTKLIAKGLSSYRAFPGIHTLFEVLWSASLVGLNHGWKADIGITSSCINLPKICPIVHPVYILQKSIMERSDSAHLQYHFVANSIASPSAYLSIESFAGSKWYFQI